MRLFYKFHHFIKSSEGARGRKVPELLSVSRTYAREARAHAHGLQTISCTGPLAPSEPPSHPMVCFAQVFILSLYGRDGKPSLTCQRTTSATMAPYRGANRYLRCLFIELSNQKNKKLKTHRDHGRAILEKNQTNRTKPDLKGRAGNLHYVTPFHNVNANINKKSRSARGRDPKRKTGLVILKKGVQKIQKAEAIKCQCPKA